MIIDVHTHFFPDFLAEKALASVVESSKGVMAIYGEGTLASLRNECGDCGVVQAVTLPVATRPDQVHSINSNLPLSQDGIIAFGALNPHDENWSNELERLVSLGVVGIKIHPEFQDFYIDDLAYTSFFEKIASVGLIVLTHAGYDPGPFTCDHATPKRIAQLLDRHPTLKLIAGHLGGLCQWNEVEKYLVGRNLYFDTAAISSLIDMPQFERIVENHGAEKVLFGSDYPWESMKKSIEFIKKSGLSDDAKDKILGLNAQKFLGVA